MTAPQLWHVAQDSCKEHQHIHHKYSVSHVELVLIAFITTRGIQSHPIRIETRGHCSTKPAVVGSEWRIVQPPVVQIIMTAVHVPAMPGDKELKLKHNEKESK